VNFYSFLIISFSILLFFKLPRVIIFENLKFLYYPVIELSHFIWDIYNLRENFEKFVLSDNFSLKTYSITFIPIIKPKEIILGVGKNEKLNYGDILTIRNVLIGKIVEVNKNSSRAITIYNSDFYASIIIKRSNYLGIFEGGEIPKISYISEGSDIKKGDTVLTSSLDGTFPYGLYIGIVGEVIEKKGIFESREVIIPYKFETLTMFNIIRKIE